MNLENYVRKQVRMILEQGSKKKSKTVGPGGGRWSNLVKGLKSRADTEPRELLKDLGISANVSGTNLLSTISMAVESATSNETFSAAFSSPSPITDSKGINGIEIGVSEISTRDGLKYISILIKALVAVGAMKLPAGKLHVERFVDKPSIIVYEGNKPRSWDLDEDEEQENNLLLEPDLSNEDERENPKYDFEVSSGGVAGPMMPLGATSNPPKNKNK